MKTEGGPGLPAPNEPLVRQNRDVTTDDRLLASATDARVRMEEAQRALLERRSEFDDAVRQLHRAGASLGEVVTGLGISEVEAGRILGSGPNDLLVCSFCGASQRDVASLIAGPFVYICGDCIVKAIQTIEAGPQHGTEVTGMTLIPTSEMSDCAFCGKERYQTKHLVTAPRGGRICDECLELCAEILAEERGSGRVNASGGVPRRGGLFVGCIDRGRADAERR